MTKEDFCSKWVVGIVEGGVVRLYDVCVKAMDCLVGLEERLDWLVGLVALLGLVGLVGFVVCIGFIWFVGFVTFVGFVKLLGFVAFVDSAPFERFVWKFGFVWLDGLVGFVWAEGTDWLSVFGWLEGCVGFCGLFVVGLDGRVDIEKGFAGNCGEFVGIDGGFDLLAKVSDVTGDKVLIFTDGLGLNVDIKPCVSSLSVTNDERGNFDDVAPTVETSVVVSVWGKRLFFESLCSQQLPKRKPSAQVPKCFPSVFMHSQTNIQVPRSPAEL